MSLLLVGHVQLPRSLARFEERILCMPYQHPMVYPWLMARCRLLVAPIEHINVFTDAKSALKGFEGDGLLLREGGEGYKKEEGELRHRLKL